MVTYARGTAPLTNHNSSGHLLKANGTTARGSAQVPHYMDFNHPVMGSNYDCTNFASHVLLSGGAKVSSGWNYQSSTNRTASWSGVAAFGTFLLGSGTGPNGQTGTAANVTTGDIIQFAYTDYNVGSWGHTTVITTNDTTIGIAGMKYTSRSGIGAFDVDYPIILKIATPNFAGYRFIKLTNYTY